MPKQWEWVSTNDSIRLYYIWFCQQREKNMPVTGPVLIEKAILSFPCLYPVASKPFNGSLGFLWWFCKRHGIRDLTIQGEKPLGDIVGATDFQQNFLDIVSNYSLYQVFNTDKTGPYYCLLLHRTLASSFEKCADGLKKPRIVLQLLHAVTLLALLNSHCCLLESRLGSSMLFQRSRGQIITCSLHASKECLGQQ